MARRGPTLVIDTAGDACAVALIVGGELAASISEPMRRGHSERLAPMISEVLSRGGASPRALGAIAVCTGPGGFSGARIGVAAARGLSLAAGAPAIGITRFEITARGVDGPAIIVARLPGGRVCVQRIRDGALVGAPSVCDPLDAVASPAPGESLLEMDAAHASAPLAFAQIARDALDAGEVPRPAPLYPRPPDAAPPSRRPPALLT